MSVTTISNPKDKEAIKKLMDEISNSYTRIAAEQDLIKETIASLSEEYEIDKKYLNKMARVNHKQNYTSITGEQEDFEFLFENIFGLPE